MTVVALGADHAGFPLKEIVKAWLTEQGHRVLDFGTHSTDSVDYPDYADAVAVAVRDGLAPRGVLVCGSGTGMAIAANKVAGVRAARCGDVETARLARAHNDSNVLTLGARTTEAPPALDIVKAWLDAPFEGGRHLRRLEKVAALERGERAHAPAR